MTTLALPIAPSESFDRRFHEPLRSAGRITTLQINIGLQCNLACRHCHVDSSPQRRSDEENMQADVAEQLIAWVAEHPGIGLIDITGGSPEMNPLFRRLVTSFRAMGRRVMDRCNPTIIEHVDKRTGANFEWVPAFLADHQVEVTASLPCYLEDNVDKQRGKGAYNASVEGLLKLNAVGYGTDPALVLNLVFNPGGASLPPPETSLEADYKRELQERFGLVFNHLFTITNMPIARFRRDLEQAGKLKDYLDKLVAAYNPATIEGLMCRHQVHVNHKGEVHDCDFNYGVSLPVPGSEGRKLWEMSMSELEHRVIGTADHCYGCTAGAGSSCGGALV